MGSMWMLGLFSLFTITILLVEVALVINVPLVIRDVNIYICLVLIRISGVVGVDEIFVPDTSI